jgi:hypothetical protein
LFDFLTLESSPACPGDRLITVEITRGFEGKAVVTPRAFGFEDDGRLRPFAGDRVRNWTADRHTSITHKSVI